MASRLRRNNWARISFFAFQDIITAVSGILILITLILATDLDRTTSARSTELQPELEMRLAQLLEEQTALELLNQQLRQSLTGARNAPGLEQLTNEIRDLKQRLDAMQGKFTNLLAVATAQRAAQAERDARLGLAAFSADIDALNKENTKLAALVADARRKMDRAESEVKRAENIVLKSRARSGMWVLPDDRSTTKEPLLVTISGSEVIAERFDQPDKQLRWASGGASADFRRFLAVVNKDNQYIVFFVRPSGIRLFEQLSDLARAQQIDIGFDAVEEKQEVHFSKPPPIEADPDTTTPVRPPVGPGTMSVGDSSPATPIKSATAEPATVPASKPPAVAAPAVPSAPASWWRRLLKSLGLA